MAEVDTADPQEIVTALLADPPVVHLVETTDGRHEMGVWSTEETCYRLIARLVGPGSKTLETGSGLSTALFAALGTEHRCITPDPHEAERLMHYLEQKRIPADKVVFDTASSHLALPRLSTELDLVLIDGGHGFPLPMVDWFYAGRLLRERGTMILDDIQLRAVGLLIDFLDQDPRWEALERTGKWAAFQRTVAGDLAEDWWQQPFYNPLPQPRGIARRAFGKARRAVAGTRGRS